MSQAAQRATAVGAVGSTAGAAAKFLIGGPLAPWYDPLGLLKRTAERPQIYGPFDPRAECPAPALSAAGAVRALRPSH